MKSFLLHRLVEFLVSHDDLQNHPSRIRIDISRDFFPISLKEYGILSKCLKFYLSSCPYHLSESDDSDDVLSLILKLKKAVDNGALVDEKL